MPPQRNLWVIGGANKRQGQQMPRLADFRGRPKFGVEMPEDSEPARNSLQTAPGAGIPSSSALALPDFTHSLCRRPSFLCDNRFSTEEIEMNVGKVWATFLIPLLLWTSAICEPRAKPGPPT